MGPKRPTTPDPRGFNDDPAILREHRDYHAGLSLPVGARRVADETPGELAVQPSVHQHQAELDEELADLDGEPTLDE